MILALEGPDCAGKTTMFEALKPLLPRAKFVGRMPCVPELIPLMHVADARQMALWEALYEPQRLYICDRCPMVSGLVYDRLYGRPSYDHSAWYPELRIVYLRPGLDELRRRHAIRGDGMFDPDKYERVVALYDDVIEAHRRVLLNPTVEGVVQYLNKIG